MLGRRAPRVTLTTICVGWLDAREAAADDAAEQRRKIDDVLPHLLDSQSREVQADGRRLEVYAFAQVDPNLDLNGWNHYPDLTAQLRFDDGFGHTSVGPA